MQINTYDPALTSLYPFHVKKPGVPVYRVPLDKQLGGMSARLIDVTSSKHYNYKGNYVLVLGGKCEINGRTFDENMVVVAKTVTAERYKVAKGAGGSCQALGVSF